MKLYLISCIEGGYAEREFGGIVSVLNDEIPCKILTLSNFKIERTADDFYIVADYYFNPTFDETKHSSLEFHKFIKSLPRSRTAIYLSDPLFKFKDPSEFDNWKYFVFFGLSNYGHTPIWMFDNCKIWENVDISEKEFLELPISELAFHSYGVSECNFEGNHSENDMTYIINSKVKSRKKLLKYLDGLKCQLGNFSKIDDQDVQNFVKRNPQNVYEQKKAFGVDYLKLQDGKYTLILGDDLEVEAALPMRIYECMWNHVIPIFTARSARTIMGLTSFKADFPVISTPAQLRDCIRILEANPMKKELYQVNINSFMEEYVFNKKRLRTISKAVLSQALSGYHGDEE